MQLETLDDDRQLLCGVEASVQSQNMSFAIKEQTKVVQEARSRVLLASGEKICTDNMIMCHCVVEKSILNTNYNS